MPPAGLHAGHPKGNTARPHHRDPTPQHGGFAKPWLLPEMVNPKAALRFTAEGTELSVARNRGRGLFATISPRLKPRHGEHREKHEAQATGRAAAMAMDAAAATAAEIALRRFFPPKRLPAFLRALGACHAAAQKRGSHL